MGAKNESPGPEVIKRCSYSTQLSTKLILLINVKIPTKNLCYFSIKTIFPIVSKIVNVCVKDSIYPVKLAKRPIQNSTFGGTDNICFVSFDLFDSITNIQSKFKRIAYQFVKYQ